MRGLTLTQPWATLVAIGAKHIETRSWGTSYYGPIAIHAAKTFPGHAKELCLIEPYRGCLLADKRVFVGRRMGGVIEHNLPLGAIVAVATLVGCMRIGEPAQLRFLTDQERVFGDFRIGRYAWILEQVRPLSEPIPCRGALGLWDVPRDIAARLGVAA